MSLLRFLKQIFIAINERELKELRKLPGKTSNKKRFVVRYQGRKKYYRVNKYGEIIEE